MKKLNDGKSTQETMAEFKARQAAEKLGGISGMGVSAMKKLQEKRRKALEQ